MAATSTWMLPAGTPCCPMEPTIYRRWATVAAEHPGAKPPTDAPWLNGWPVSALENRARRVSSSTTS